MFGPRTWTEQNAPMTEIAPQASFPSRTAAKAAPSDRKPEGRGDGMPFALDDDAAPHDREASAETEATVLPRRFASRRADELSIPEPMTADAAQGEDISPEEVTPPQPSLAQGAATPPATELTGTAAAPARPSASDVTAIPPPATPQARGGDAVAIAGGDMAPPQTNPASVPPPPISARNTSAHAAAGETPPLAGTSDGAVAATRRDAGDASASAPQNVRYAVPANPAPAPTAAPAEPGQSAGARIAAAASPSGGDEPAPTRTNSAPPQAGVMGASDSPAPSQGAARETRLPPTAPLDTPGREPERAADRPDIRSVSPAAPRDPAGASIIPPSPGAAAPGGGAAQGVAQGAPSPETAPVFAPEGLRNAPSARRSAAPPAHAVHATVASTTTMTGAPSTAPQGAGVAFARSAPALRAPSAAELGIRMAAADFASAANPAAAAGPAADVASEFGGLVSAAGASSAGGGLSLSAGPVAVTSGPELARAVGDQLSVALSRRGRDVVELQLDPPELGRVRLTLGRGEHGLTAAVMADRPEVADLLRRHADVLTQALTDAGQPKAELRFGSGSGFGAEAGGFGQDAGAEGEGSPDRQDDAVRQSSGAASPLGATGPRDGLDLRV